MPLTRTRRRLLIATLVVVGCAIGFWTTRPQIDDRLVGVWTESERMGREIDFLMALTLRADGTGEWYMGDRFRWTVDNNRILLVTVRNKYAEIFPTPVLDLYASLSGSRPHIAWTYEIVEMTPTRLTICCTDVIFVSGNRVELLPVTFDRPVKLVP